MLYILLNLITSLILNCFMPRKKYTEDQFIGMTAQVLSFISIKLCEYGYLLAFENELPDLKGLVELDTISNADFELLETLQDPAVKVVVQSIHKVEDCLKSYMLINNLDEYEVLDNEDYRELAADSFFAYVIECEGQTYTDILNDLNGVYYNIYQLLYHTTRQLTLNEMEIFDQVYDEFFEVVEDLLNNRIDTDNKNVALLHNLITTLAEDEKLLDQIE